MEYLEATFQWIGSKESVLSGIAASIVILGVLYVPIHKLFQRSTAPNQPQDAARSIPRRATVLHTDSPSIAVMPFANLSGDPAHEFLADGLTEDIILGLSRFKQLFVIARNTCFTYKGTTPDAQLVSEQLGVRYVLEGSVRKIGDRIRVTAQLVDASTRTPCWAERFDRKLEEILVVDDEVTEAIVAALQPALRRAEVDHARRAAPGDLTAWALVNRAWVSIQSDLGDLAAATEAIQACERALTLDRDYAFAHAVRAHAKSLLVNRPGPHPAGTREEAVGSIKRALELAPDDALVHHCHAAILGNLGRTDDAIRAWERAIELDPNSAGARAGLGISLIFKARADQSLVLIDAALRRSPADPLQYHWLSNRALALALTGRLPEAIDVARQSLERKPSWMAYAVLAGSLACEHRIEEAGEAWLELRARFDELVAEDFARLAGALAPNPEWGKVIAQGIRLAGQTELDRTP